MMNNPVVEVVKLEPITVSPKQAAELLGLSLSSFYAACSSGAIGPQGQKIGKRRLFSVKELKEWCAAGMPPRRVWIQMKSN